MLLPLTHKWTAAQGGSFISDREVDGRSSEIPLRILKEYASEIAPMLTFIMQQSYDTGTLPEDWNNANVVALFKKEIDQKQRTTDQ